MTTHTCDTCKFAVDDKTSKRTNGLLCMRFPPQVLVDPIKLILISRFPRVEEGDWCGEHITSLED